MILLSPESAGRAARCENESNGARSLKNVVKMGFWTKISSNFIKIWKLFRKTKVFRQNFQILMKFDEIFLPAFFMLFVPGGKFCADSDDNKTESVRGAEMRENLWYVRQSLNSSHLPHLCGNYNFSLRWSKKLVFLKTAENQFFSSPHENFAPILMMIKLFPSDEQKWVKIHDLWLHALTADIRQYQHYSEMAKKRIFPKTWATLFYNCRHAPA